MTTSAASDTSVTKTDCSDDDYTEDCKYYQWRLDRLSEWKNYLDEYNKKVDDFKGDEDLSREKNIKSYNILQNTTNDMFYNYKCIFYIIIYN